MYEYVCFYVSWGVYVTCSMLALIEVQEFKKKQPKVQVVVHCSSNESFADDDASCRKNKIVLHIASEWSIATDAVLFQLHDPHIPPHSVIFLQPHYTNNLTSFAWLACTYPSRPSYFVLFYSVHKTWKCPEKLLG